MDMCTAHIALGGDIGSIVVRDQFNPVSWPEVGVLQFIHGEEAVFNVKVIETFARHKGVEKERLKGIYGDGPVEMIYPGKSPMMEMHMPGPRDPDDEDDEDTGDISEEELEANIAAMTSKKRGRPKKDAGKVKGVLRVGDKDVLRTEYMDRNAPSNEV